MAEKKALPSPNKAPKGGLTSDALERRYDKQREKDLLVMPQKPTGYKKGGKIDGCAIRGKTKGKMV